jgi:hypothetical protein
MAEEAPWIDDFNLWESYIGTPSFTDTTIRIPFRKLGVFSGFDGHAAPYTFYEHCVLVYEDVISSVRRVREFTPDRRGFKSETGYTIEDGPFMPTAKQVYTHEFNSISDELNGWVNWKITAASLRLEAGIAP